jgi:hypothetical protein
MNLISHDLFIAIPSSPKSTARQKKPKMTIGNGSNILRGGQRTYNCKTLVGNFVEEVYRPNAVKSTWSGGENYETSTRNQMNLGTGIKPKSFGTGLKKLDEAKYDYTQLIGPDKTRGTSTWISMTHSAHANSSSPIEFAAPRFMKGNPLSNEELVQHRARWTNENEELKRLRYVTENAAMQDTFVKDQFKKKLISTK